VVPVACQFRIYLTGVLRNSGAGFGWPKVLNPLSAGVSPHLEIAAIVEEVRRVRLREMGITLVPVLVPVCTAIWCDLVRSDAIGLVAKIPMDTGDLRVFANPCEGLRKGKKGTQNPPTARSWGFDPPSRHQHISSQHQSPRSNRRRAGWAALLASIELQPDPVLGAKAYRWV
jgi:hypothetical protein